tara:strand:- start:10 stop:1488 length:1479 start_codon:yes stop_codon:yes gene_type:complete
MRELLEKINYNNIELDIKTNRGSFSVETINGGTSGEKRLITFKGRIRKNVPTVIGTLTITTSTDADGEPEAYINKKPSITEALSNIKKDLGANIEIAFTSSKKLKRDSSSGRKGNDFNLLQKKSVYEYTFDLIYTQRKTIPKDKQIKYKLSHGKRLNRKIDPVNINSTEKPLLVNTKKIDTINFSSADIPANGGDRLIFIKGDPKTQFELILIKSTDIKDSSGKVVNTIEEDGMSDNKWIYVDKGGKPILETNGSADFKVIRGETDASGKWTFNHKVPQTSVNIRWGVAIRPLTIETSHEIPDAASFILSPSFKKSIKKQGWIYGNKVLMYPQINNELRDNTGVFPGWIEWIRKDANQNSITKLFFRVTTSNSNITTINGVTPGNLKSHIFKGKPNNDYNRPKIRLTYVLISASHTFGVKGGFPNTVSFTNYDSLTNGGTVFNVNNITGALSDTGGSGRYNTFTLSVDFDVSVLGLDTITTILNLDDVVTCA